MNWNTSNRHHRLPTNWAAIRKRAIEAANGQCQAHQHHPQCDRRATDVDHINPGDDHTLANLQALSTACHKAKTAAESRARNKQRSRKRPTEKHPGLL